MYRKVLNYLRGQVTVEVESAAPERVLNLCAAHNIPFWELEWLSEIRLRAVTSRAALPRLHRETANARDRPGPQARREAPYAGEARGKPSGGRFGLRPQPGTLHLP